MSKTPNFDAKVKAILDELKPGERVCEMTGEKWMMDEEEISWYKKFNVPPTNWSPMTRWYVLGGLLFGFEWWWNKHAETGKPILTYVHPASGVRVLPDEEWYQKDFRDHGRSFNHERPFFDQLLELRKTVPLPATLNTKKPENSISLDCFGDTNSYFAVSSQSKNCFYVSDSLRAEHSAELYMTSDVTRSYNIVHSQRIYNCKVVRESFDCQNSAFLFDCRNCEDCFGATNQRNKKFIFFNEQLNEEEYQARVKQIDLSRRSAFEEYVGKFTELINKQAVWPESFNERSADCVGDYLTDCNDCSVCFMSDGGPRGCGWCAYLYGGSHSNYFLLGGNNSSDQYASCLCNESAQSLFCLNLVRCIGMEYSLNCFNSENCFGCVGLDRKSFCIFNQQYSEEDYWHKLDEIKCSLLEKGEYGSCLPPTFSTSYFPESVAGKNMAISEADQKRLGFPVFDPESAGAVGELEQMTGLQSSNEVPDAISEIKTTDWSGRALYDQETKRRFAYLPAEVELYRELGVPMPVHHFVWRMARLHHAANTFIMEDATCAECLMPLRVAKNVTFSNRKHLCREDYLKFLDSR